MGLEQLFPGELYRTVVEINKELCVKRPVLDKVTPIAYELIRDFSGLVCISKMLSDYPPGEKMFDAGSFAALYVLITYGLPQVLKGRNYLINKLYNKTKE
ncbi:hypothetical protein HZA97_03970 [Candidatus Woesearchaeota archaeon]|nr:hypothetical protein [Candidatus Woesearchaeota archaeon]